MKTVNIIIDDENLYFAAGLRHSITEYAQANKKNICFLAPDVGAPADVVLASSCRRTQRWRSVGAAPVVMIKERPLAADCALQRVLYRTDSRQRLFELLGEALVARHSLVRSPKTNAHLPRAPGDRPLKARIGSIANRPRDGGKRKDGA